MQDNGVKISAVRPHDRPEFGIHAHSSEHGRCTERLEDTLKAYQALEVNLTLDPVAKSQV